MKQTHLLLLIGILLFLCYCNRDKIEAFGIEAFGIEAFGIEAFGIEAFGIEAFGNQLIVPQFEFAILTPNQDPMSGYFQEEVCRDDPEWRKGDKKCIDYSMDRNNCIDKGENGKSAMDACPVSCDSCPSSVKIKRRLPSPVEDVEEPDYAVFEEVMNLSGGMDSIDYREIYERLDQINVKLEELNIGECPSCDDGGGAGDEGGGGGGGAGPDEAPTPQPASPSQAQGSCTFWWNELGVSHMQYVLEEELPNRNTKDILCKPTHRAITTGGRGVCNNGTFQLQDDVQCVPCTYYNDGEVGMTCDECAPGRGCISATCAEGYSQVPDATYSGSEEPGVTCSRP